MTMMNIGAFGTLAMYLDEVTPEQIARQGSKIGKRNGETILTNLRDTDIPRLWCAMVVLAAKAEETAARAKTAADDNAEEVLTSEAQQLKRLHKLARDLFWYEVNEQVGWNKDVGLRDGWDVVEVKSDGGPQIFAGGLGNLKKFLEGLGGGE